MLEDIIMANKLQISLDDDIYEIIKNLKPRTVKLFVSVAIEEFVKQPESKLFFKNTAIIERNKEVKIIEIEEVKKTSSMEEWN